MMKINEQTAVKLYEDSPSWFKEQLEEAFGKKLFYPKSFRDIKTFDDACNRLGISQKNMFTTIDSPDEIAYKKLKIIARAINEGWEPDWSDRNEYKWWPWFNLSSGFGFSGSHYHFTYSGTAVGSRLCFETEQKSDYAAKQFVDLYQQFLTI